MLFIIIAFSFAVNTLTFTEQQSITKKTNHFPKILWVYWEQDIEQASTFTKLCINNQKRYAEVSGWQFKLLSYKSIGNYVNLSEVNHIWQHAALKNVQSRSDILRYFLLLKYGGMWMDANSFFVGNLSWVDNLKGLPQIINQYGDEPQVLISSLAFKRIIPIVKIDKQTGQPVLLNPNIEDWFILAKPNSLFLREVLKTIQKMCLLGLDGSNQYFRSLGVVNWFETWTYFFFSNYVFQVMIQLKQIEFNQSGKQEFAVHYYKIWNFDGEQTAFNIQTFYNFQTWTTISDIMTKSLAEFQRQINGPNFIVKFTSTDYPSLNKIFDNYMLYNCWGLGFDIKIGSLVDQFLLTNVDQIEIIQQIRSFYQHQTSAKAGQKDLCNIQMQLKQHITIFEIISLFIILLFFINVWIFFAKQLKRQRQQIDLSE